MLMIIMIIKTIRFGLVSLVEEYHHKNCFCNLNRTSVGK